MTFNALSELLNSDKDHSTSSSIPRSDERVIHSLTSTSPNLVHELRIVYLDDAIQFVLNGVALRSLDIRVSELTSQNIFVSATLYESSQEVGLLGEPFHDIGTTTDILSSSSIRRWNTNDNTEARTVM